MPPRLNLGKAFLRWHGLTWLILTAMFNAWGAVGPPALCGRRFRPPFQLIGILLLDHLLPTQLEAIDRSSGQALPFCWRGSPREARQPGGAAEQGQMGGAASARPGTARG